MATTLTVKNVIDFLDGVTTLAFIDKATFTAMGEELMLNADSRYDKEEAPDGSKWQDISPHHKAFKRKRDYGDKILSMRGHLRNLLRAHATDTELRFGSDRVYARLMHDGGNFKAFGKYNAVMPARPFLYNADGSLSDEDRQSIKEVVSDAWVTWVARNS